jgi:hypothetical protein
MTNRSSGATVEGGVAKHASGRRNGSCAESSELEMTLAARHNRTVEFDTAWQSRTDCIPGDDMTRFRLGTGCAIVYLILLGGQLRGDEPLFRDRIVPIFQRRCLSCHNDREKKGDLSLQTPAAIESSGVIEPGDADASTLVEMISPRGAKPAEMPKNADPLSADEIKLIRDWIAAGAKWPEGFRVEPARVTDADWWSLKPLSRPAVPSLGKVDTSDNWPVTPIDAFVLAKLREQGLEPSPEADPRTLMRRLYFDLIGLPPKPEEVAAFEAASIRNPQSAFRNLVDRLLESPQYGERWARHWLDVVHYGDTHGYDKDKLRPNAWPYRDYVIRAFNDDKPYSQFVREQLAGDVLFPDSSDGVVATGFIAAGPFDWVGQIEVRDGTTDKQITRNLDRDDMVQTAMNTFVSLTVGCARCHNHKFDPITQEDYYSLQAVFAGVDRADRPYDVSREVAAQRAELRGREQQLAADRAAIEQKIRDRAGDSLKEIENRIAKLTATSAVGEKPEFGYHSLIAPRPDVAKWVQVDLGKPTPIQHIIYVGCHDTFAGIGAGFGFPVRYKIEISDDAEFKFGVVTVVDRTDADVANPGVTPQTATVGGKTARYIRVTATKLALRQNDYIFALAELIALTPDGQNGATGATVTALDSIEAPVRWRRTNLVDGYYYGVGKDGTPGELAQLGDRRQKMLDQFTDAETKQRLAAIGRQLAETSNQLGALPQKGVVFAAAANFAAQGNFRPTGGTPREIHVLDRGSVTAPGEEAQPGTVSCVGGLSSRFELQADHGEGVRRAALARWITEKDNPLTWRSIVNRIWQYHFGSGIVGSPNDFGRMGQLPTHPQLLDWLAVEFRDGGDWIRRPQSIKELHRLIVTSAVYRQSSVSNPEFATLDAGDQFLWRMNRRRLEAEAIRDAVLAVSGKLDLTMYGPGFHAFAIEKPEHSPHYLYEKHDPDDPRSHRRSIYRFIVRSVPDPFMVTLDCADPSQIVPRRNETLTALSALALLNNRFMVRMAGHFADRVKESSNDVRSQVTNAFKIALARSPSDEELSPLVGYAKAHGLANTCRIILNMSEFVFVD